MANVNSPFGLRLIGMLTGGIGNVSIRRYRIPASETHPIFMGDPVMRMAGSSTLASGTNRSLNQQAGSLNQQAGLEYVERAGGADNQAILGVVVGFAYDPTNLTLNYSVGSAERDVFICDDPNAIYEIQSDVTGITAAQLGKNCLMTVTAGTSPAYVSGAVATGPAADASYPLLILGWSKDPKNDIASQSYAKIIVRINNHQLTTGVGYGALGV